MTMPDITDDGPRLAELARFMQDFRSEFRHAMESVVRKDVYAANLATLEAQMAITRADNARLDKELARLDKEIDSERKQRASNNSKFMFAILAAGLSLLGNIIMVVIR